DSPREGPRGSATGTGHARAGQRACGNVIVPPHTPFSPFFLDSFSVFGMNFADDSASKNQHQKSLSQSLSPPLPLSGGRGGPLWGPNGPGWIIGPSPGTSKCGA